jgi:hypothetical protein
MMNHFTTVTVRLKRMDVAALDALTEREGGTRTQKVRESIALRLDLEAQRMLIAEVVRTEVQTAVAQMVKASKASDDTSRQLILDFLDGISSTQLDEAAPPTTAIHAAIAETAHGGVALPAPRND